MHKPPSLSVHVTIGYSANNHLFFFMSSNTQDRSSELVQLMMKHQRKLFGYILTLVPSRADAEDILQEASLTICEKFSSFEPGTNFILGLAK